jgi:hypothetical protein
MLKRWLLRPSETPPHWQKQQVMLLSNIKLIQTSSANKLVDRKVHFYLLLRNKKYAKKGTREFVQVGETAKIGCIEN